MCTLPYIVFINFSYRAPFFFLLCLWFAKTDWWCDDVFLLSLLVITGSAITLRLVIHLCLKTFLRRKKKKKLKRQWNWSCARNLMCVCRWQFSREAPFLFVPFLKNGHESSRSWLCRRLPFYLQRWRGEVDQEALLKCTSPPLLIHSLLTAAGSVPKGRKNLAKFQFQKRLLLHCKKKKKKRMSCA